MRTEFDTLPEQIQQPYLDWAKHLVQKGYTSTNDVKQVAREMWEKKVLDKKPK